MNSMLQPARMLIAVGFLMLLLTSLQGWAMVGVIAVAGESQATLLHELKRLHNLGLSGGFLALGFGLAMIALALDASRCRTVYRVLLPSLLIAPVGFSDKVSAVVCGPIPITLQVGFFGLQALSALGITIALTLMLVAVLRDRSQDRDD